MPRWKRDKSGKIMKGVRDYRKEYDEYHGTGKQKKNRAARNGARRRINAARKRRGLSKLPKTMEVDHKRPLSKGGGNGKGNTRVTTRRANRRKYNK